MNRMTVHRDNDVSHAAFIQKCMLAKGYALTEDDKAVGMVCKSTHNDSVLCYLR